MDPSFRDATDDDVPAILEIYNEQILNGTATFHTEPQTVVERAEWLSKLKAKRYPCLVAELPEAGTGAKRTVAWANLQAYHDRPAYDGTAELSLYVHKDFRGTGIGQKLLRVFARRDEETGRPVPYDYIVASENERTMKFWTEHGFQLRGTVKEVGRKFGRWLDVSYFQLML